MPMRNRTYRGPEVMIKLMRASNYPWQIKSMRNGLLISNAQYTERYRPAGVGNNAFLNLHAPVKAETKGFITVPTQIADYDRELRNLHSKSSRENHNEYESPNSIYVSMTSSKADTSWGEGANPTIVFRFDIWRSDVWKGNHEIQRDPELQSWLADARSRIPKDQVLEFLCSQTPADWDRGAEFEWLALGGTKVYNVEESRDGVAWAPSVATRADIDFWWEAL